MRISLLGGTYEARSIIANAQRCVNLYPETNQQDAPVPVTHYPTAGLNLLAADPQAGWRCLYRASNGSLYGVAAQNVYSIDGNWTRTLLGTLTSVQTPVSMIDNGLVIVVVDGTPNGYTISMVDNQYLLITDPAFYGSDRADYIDTFFVFNRPGTNEMYSSPSEWIPGIAFDPLAIAAKSGYPDNIQGIIVMHREMWILGTLTTEIWYDAGAPDFPFAILPGTFIEHGCAAKYSIIKAGLSVFWLSQDLRGTAVVLKGHDYAAQRISTFALENEFQTYATVNDAIGYTYQLSGHTYYALAFPTANKTWVWDDSTSLWHEEAWTDVNGNLNRHRANCAAFANDKVICGDWETGNLYAYDLNTYTDNGNPITRIRSFPHILNDSKRVIYNQFIADMDVGEATGNDGFTDANPPTVTLRWSDDRGRTYSNGVQQSIGGPGQTYTNIQFRRLGMARDRVFELSWSVPVKTALNGAFVEITPAAT